MAECEHFGKTSEELDAEFEEISSRYKEWHDEEKIEAIEIGNDELCLNFSWYVFYK